MKKGTLYRTLKFILIVLPFFSTIKLKAQQEPIYSQYIFNGLVMNPAFAGYKETLNFQTFYRDQWTNLQGSPKTFSASVDGSFSENRMGLGIDFLSDAIGLQKTQSAYLSYAYRLKFNESSKLSLGLSIGIIQNSLSGNLFDPTDPVDPILNTYANKVIKPDMKAGLLYASDHVFASLSFTNLLSNIIPAQSSTLYIKSTPHGYLSAGVIYPITNFLKIKPSFLLRGDFNSPLTSDLNGFLIFENKFWAGFSYRNGIQFGKQGNLSTNLPTNNAMVFLLDYYISPQLRIGYSYDYATTSLQKVSGGSHEISIGYTFGKRSTALLSPRFF